MDLVVDLPSPSGGSNGGGGGASGSGRCRYRAVTKINSGSFGDILAAVNEVDPADWVALKVQARYPPADVERRRTSHSMVRFEHMVCRELAQGACEDPSAGVGVDGGQRGGGPRVCWCPCPAVWGCISLHDEHDVLAMELLGPNLREYGAALGRWPLPEDLVLVLGAALVGRLQQLHAAGFVHRDIKPDNVLLSLEEGPEEAAIPRIVFVDFALSMRFASPGGAGHIGDNGATVEVAGTHRYMAVHAQQGVTQTRRSDLESLAHVLVYLVLAKLPWQHLKDTKEMCRVKEKYPVEELCQGLHPAFADFLLRCRALKFEEKPDYEALQRGLLAGVRGPVDFEAARVRKEWRNDLREHYLRCLEDQARLAPLAPAPALPPRARAPPLAIFVRHDGKGELLRRPPAPSETEKGHGFAFEAFSEPLRGTRHVVVGKSHFFAFMSSEAARLEGGVGVSQQPGDGGAEQIVLFSSGRRDWVVRAATVPDYEASSDAYGEWNLRSKFWARVFLP